MMRIILILTIGQLIYEIVNGIREVNYPLIILLNPFEDNINFKKFFKDIKIKELLQF